MKYKDQLKSGKWQRKRLIIMARDDFRCQSCGDDGFLNVHHLEYRGKAWEAKSRDLITLCDTCHSNLHKKESIYLYIAFMRNVCNCLIESDYTEEKSLFVYDILGEVNVHTG